MAVEEAARAGRDAEGSEVVRSNAGWYFAGLAASLVGNSAMSLVHGVWVKKLTGSSSQAGLVSACIYAATMGAPVAGLIADRVPRRGLLLGLNLLSAATIAPWCSSPRALRCGSCSSRWASTGSKQR